MECPWNTEPLVAFNPNRPRPPVEIQLSPQEFVEVVEEIYDLNLSDIVGPRPGLPRIRMYIECKDPELMNRLNALHIEYCRKVRETIDEMHAPSAEVAHGGGSLHLGPVRGLWQGRTQEALPDKGLIGLDSVLGRSAPTSATQDP